MIIGPGVEVVLVIVSCGKHSAPELAPFILVILEVIPLEPAVAPKFSGLLRTVIPEAPPFAEVFAPGLVNITPPPPPPPLTCANKKTNASRTKNQIDEKERPKRKY